MTRGEFVSMVYASATRNRGDFAWYARRSLGIPQPSGAEAPPNLGEYVDAREAECKHRDARAERYKGVMDCMRQRHGVTYDG